MNAIIEYLEPTIDNVVRRTDRLPIDEDDRRQEATLAALKHLGRYEAGRGVQLASFLFWRMLGEVRSLARRNYLLQGGRRSGRSEANVQRLGDKIRISAHGASYGSGILGATVEDLVVDRDNETAAAIAELESADEFEGLLRLVSPRRALLLRLYFQEGLTLDEAGQRLGLGESRASQVVAETLARLRAMLPRRAERPRLYPLPQLEDPTYAHENRPGPTAAARAAPPPAAAGDAAADSAAQPGEAAPQPHDGPRRSRAA